MSEKSNKIIKKLCKYTLIIWISLMLVISLILLLNTLGVTDFFKNKAINSEYKKNVKEWNVNPEVKNLNSTLKNYDITYSQLSNNVFIWEISNNFIAYSNKVNNDNNDKAFLDLHLYDINLGKHYEVSKLKNNNFIDYVTLTSEYISWNDSSGSYIKKIAENSEIIKIPDMYHKFIFNNILYYANGNLLCRYDINQGKVIDTISLSDNLFTYKLIANDTVVALYSSTDVIIYNYANHKTLNIKQPENENIEETNNMISYNELSLINDKIYLINTYKNQIKTITATGEVEVFKPNSSKKLNSNTSYTNSNYLSLETSENSETEFYFLDLFTNQEIKLDLSNLIDNNYNYVYQHIYNTNILLTQCNSSTSESEITHLIKIKFNQ